MDLALPRIKAKTKNRKPRPPWTRKVVAFLCIWTVLLVLRVLDALTGEVAHGSTGDKIIWPFWFILDIAMVDYNWWCLFGPRRYDFQPPPMKAWHAIALLSAIAISIPVWLTEFAVWLAS